MIGARATFCAGHKLPHHEEVHGHSYEVWAFTAAELDIEEWQKRLQAFCKQLDHKMLPPELAKMECIALRIGNNIGAKFVRVIRPVEGLCCEWHA